MPVAEQFDFVERTGTAHDCFAVPLAGSRNRVTDPRIVQKQSSVDAVTHTLSPPNAQQERMQAAAEPADIRAIPAFKNVFKISFEGDQKTAKAGASGTDK